jgi:hypothetical protein
MEVTFTQDYKVAIDGINIVDFAKNSTHTLPKEKAELYISRGVCTKAEVENKMAQPVVETAVQKPMKLKKGK